MEAADLFKAKLREAQVEVEGVGTITVKALNRATAMKIAGIDNLATMEHWALVGGMVDPPISMKDAKRWHEEAPSYVIEPVINKILELSGMIEGAEKEATKRFPGSDGDA